MIWVVGMRNCRPRSAGISNAAKQELLLELCQCFHPYLMKYLVMICRGHVPILGIGPKSTFGNVNGDVRKFLYYFLPKGQTLTRQNLNPVVRHLHLAFKDMETEERYDVLMEQMVRAINQYDLCVHRQSEPDRGGPQQ
jgi:hypothetical protein